MRHSFIFIIAGLTIGHSVQATETKTLDCIVKPEMYVELSSPVDGTLESISVNTGDPIQKGQILAKLESSVESARVRLAKQETMLEHVIQSKKIELGFTERNKKRYQGLYEKEAIAFYEEDRANTDEALARLAVDKSIADQKAAELQLQLALTQLEQKSIKSPINGIVLERFLMPGESVSGRPIMKLAQINPLRVELVAPAEVFGQIKKGMSAEIKPEKPANQIYKATVTSVDQLIDPASGSFTVRMSLPNPDDSIIAGVNCTATFNTQPSTPEKQAIIQPQPAQQPEPSKLEQAIVPIRPIVDVKPKTPVITSPVLAISAPITPAKPTEQPSPKPISAQVTPAPLPTSDRAPSPSPVINLLSQTIANQQSLLLTEQSSVTPDEFAKIFKNLTTYSQSVVQTESNSSACFTLGPFASKEQLNRFIQKFPTIAKNSKITHKEQQLPEGYFLLYPAAATFEESTANATMLKSRGFKNVMLLRKGEDRGAISLGFANDSDKANQVAEKLRKHGVVVQIKLRTKVQIQYFTEFSLADKDLASVEQHLAATKKRLPELSLQKLPACS